MIDLQPYELSCVAGLVQHLRLDPANGCIEAAVSDGTGLVVARWPIRRPTPELAAAPGEGVILEGVPMRDICVEFVFLDPTLTLARFPEVA
jgi:hypothetical protein